MIINNEKVVIKIGKKKLDFHNLILDNYLKKMVNSQKSDIPTNWKAPIISNCYIKFDRKLNFDKTSILSADDFDIALNLINYSEKKGNAGVTVNYQYGLEDGTWINYIDKKITCLGFSCDNDNFLACLDTSEYSLTIKQNEDVTISRTDTFKTDAYFNSNNSLVNYPVHLSVDGIDAFINEDFLNNYNKDYYISKNSFGHLFSVGLGTNKNLMSKEIQINKDNVIYTDNSIIFKNLANGEILEGLLYPGFKIPNSTNYPIKTGDLYSYIFFKFKIYNLLFNKNDYTDNFAQDTGFWYTLSVPIKENGEFNYSIKYERL